jgi:hypothetical protein
MYMRVSGVFNLVKRAFDSRLALLALLFAAHMLYPLKVSAGFHLSHQKQEERNPTGNAEKKILFHAPDQSSVTIFSFLSDISSNKYLIVAGKKNLSCPQAQRDMIQEKKPERTDETGVIKSVFQNITYYKFRLNPVKSPYRSPSSVKGKDIPVNLHRLRL